MLRVQFAFNSHYCLAVIHVLCPSIAVANAKTTMKCWHNVVRRRRKKPTAAAAAKGSKGSHGGVASPRDEDAICQRQQQVDTYTWLTTQAVPLLWLHLLLLVAFAKHAAAATTIATNPEATTTTVSNYTVTTTALSSSTTTTSSGSAPASSSAADKFAGNWANLEDSFRNIVRIGDGNTVTRVSH